MVIPHFIAPVRIRTQVLMRTRCFWCIHLSLLLSFPFCLLSLHSLILHLLFFRSLFSPCFFLFSFSPFSILVFCRSSFYSFFFPSAPYKYMGGYEAKERKIDRKVTFFLWNLSIWKVYLAKLCGNVLQNTPTFANSISFRDFLFWPSLSVSIHFP